MSLRRAMRQWSRVFKSRLTHLNASKFSAASLKKVTRVHFPQFLNRFPSLEIDKGLFRERLMEWMKYSSSGQNSTAELNVIDLVMDPTSRNDQKARSLKMLSEEGDKAQSAYDSSSGKATSRDVMYTLKLRRIRMREDLLMKKLILQQVFLAHQMEMKAKLYRRRELLRQAVQLKKEDIDTKERQLRERGRFLMEDFRSTKHLMREKFEEAIERENIYTIPNLLCLTRITFSPYLGYLILTANFHHALAFMTIAGFSDWLDGWIARNYPGQSSKFGSFLDPMADKVLIGTLFISLTYVDLIPLWLTSLIIGRDVLLVAAGFVIRYNSLPPPKTLRRYFDATNVTAQLAPTMISKVNTGVQLALVALTLAAPVVGYVDHPALHGLRVITAATTVVAAISYILSKGTFKYITRKKL